MVDLSIAMLVYQRVIFRACGVLQNPQHDIPKRLEKNYAGPLKDADFERYFDKFDALW